MTHTQTDRGHLIGIIGAGPAGLYAAKKLAEAGAHVVLFNRDIKPGGLAEYAVGVVHAKDLVYHYNHLPPFSQRQFPIGRRVAIIGMGNVMIDIAHFLLRLRQDVEEVIVVARRGPAERKYDEKEYKYIEAFVDQDALRQEIARLRPRLEAVGQDAEALIAEMTTT